MKKRIVFLLSALCLVLYVQAQNGFSGISLSGFKVSLNQSDKFSYEVDETIEIATEIKDGILSLRVIDQTGKIPKSYIKLYVNTLNFLKLESSELVMDSPISVDSLSVVVGNFSSGELDVKANYLSVDVNDNGRFSVKGEVSYLAENNRNFSNLDLSGLSAKAVVPFVAANTQKKKQTQKGKVELTGIIKSGKDAKAISGATLQLVNPDDGGVDFAETDEDGVFEFRNISQKGISNPKKNEERKLLLKIRKKGYPSKEIPVTVKNKQKVELGIISL